MHPSEIEVQVGERLTMMSGLFQMHPSEIEVPRWRQTTAMPTGFRRTIVRLK